MKTAIVTTTINSPTEAIIAFANIAKARDWQFYIVGDKRTPDKEYEQMPEKYRHNTVYLSPEWQETHYPELSGLIGWNCIQRRNMGFLAALKAGVDIIATVDDDNIPSGEWGTNILVNKTVEVERFAAKQAVFDPFSVTNHSQYWHRGFPVQLIEEKNFVAIKPKKKRKVLVQADFWHGAPDIDAICRITYGDPLCFFEIKVPFCSDQIAPFNSQNTFLSSELFPEYFLFPGIGRMDDIFAAYHIQHVFLDSVIFGPASVYQRRNPHDFVKDMEQEMIGYENALAVAMDPEKLFKILPEQAKQAFELYKIIVKSF
jgi:hypothetical protein